MPFKTIPQDKFTGLVAAMSRYVQPEGSVSRISNLYTSSLTRGTLVTVDGTKVMSSPGGLGPTTGKPPIRYIAVYGSTILGLRPDGTNISLLVLANSQTLPAFVASTYQTPLMCAFDSDMIIAPGLDVTPRIWNGSSLATMANSWTIGNVYSSWSASNPQQAGDVINGGNGHVYVAIVGGLTGGSAPTFPTGSGATVVDGSVTWQESGPSAPGAPKGAIALFNHLDFLWVWGTSATYSALDGPDALWQSDIANPGSFNPLNMSFIGRGDGQQAQGGAVWSVQESGIAPTPRLVLFKDYSTYEVIGAFPIVQIQQAKTDMGNTAPLSAMFCAELGGILRLTNRGVALYRGPGEGADQIVSDSIQPYLFGNADITGIDWANANLAVAGRSANPALYLLAVPLKGNSGALSRVLMLDLAASQGAQSIIWAGVADLPFNISALAFIQQSGAAGVTWVGGYSDGAARQWWAGDPDWDGAAINWTVRPRYVFGDASTPLFVRRFNARIRALSGNPSLTSATLHYDPRTGGAEKTLTLRTPAALTGSITVGKTVADATVELAGSGNVQIDGIDWQVAPKAPSRIGAAV